MASISGNYPSNYDNINAGQAKSARTGASSAASSAQKTYEKNAEVVDTVEISEEAAALLDERNNRFAPMNPKKALEKDSAAEKKFRELLQSVKSQKSGVMSEIENALKKAGISISGLGKLKLEVDSSGRIVAGGLRDKAANRAVEKALNDVGGLGAKIKQYQADEKNLSKEIKDYTGCSLYELTMTSQGNINRRIRDTMDPEGENNLGDDYYWNLAFMGDTASVVGKEDVVALSFSGMIDFSGETRAMAEPEKTIKESMQGMFGKVTDKFAAINGDLLATMKDRGVELDPEFRETYLLDASRVNITVNNLGEVQIDGMLAKDRKTHDKGVEIIKQMVQEMLNETDDNSYHMNMFTAAGESMVNRMADEIGSEEGLGRDAKVTARIRNGIVTDDIKVSAPKAEAEVQKSVQEGVNQVLADAGIQLAEPLEIEVDDYGKIRAVNMPEDAEEAKKIGQLLDRLNGDVERSDAAEKKEKAEEEKEKQTSFRDWDEGVRYIAAQLAKLNTLRQG